MDAQNGTEGYVVYGPDRRPWRETVSEIAVTEDGELLVSPPSTDPLKLVSYPEVPGVTGSLYQVPSSGHTTEQHQRALKEAIAHLSKESQAFLSFQGDLDFKCDPLTKELISSKFLLGGGDPFVDGPCNSNLKWMERNVLDYFASIWHAKWPHNPTDPDTYWGHVMSLDTTEGAYYCLRNARDYLTGKFIDQTFNLSTYESNEIDPREIDIYSQGQYESANISGYTPVVFFSSEAHHSFSKAAHTVNIPTFYSLGVQLYPNECPLGTEWPHFVPCEGGDAGLGTVDIQALGKLVDFFSGKGHPIVVVFNYGSCFKGVCDDVKRAGETLIPILKKNGMCERTLKINDSIHIIRKGFWFHVDGIMAAMYMPFFEMGHRKGLIAEKPGPVFDFRLDFVTSLAANCHTWLGCPWHCSVYMTRSSHQLRKTFSHFGFFDTSLSGARNVLSTVILWSHFGSVNYTKQVEEVMEHLAMAQYVEKKMKELELKIGVDLWVMRSPHSFVINFRKPSDNIVQKYHLAVHTVFIRSELREYAQVCRLDKQNIELLLDDLCQPHAFSS